MPIIKSAQKKLKQDKKRNAVNSKVREQFKKALKVARREPTPENTNKAYSMVDLASKKNVIHKNKAARLKSRLIHSLTKNKKTVVTAIT